MKVIRKLFLPKMQFLGIHFNEDTSLLSTFLLPHWCVLERFHHKYAVLNQQQTHKCVHCLYMPAVFYVYSLMYYTQILLLYSGVKRVKVRHICNNIHTTALFVTVISTVIKVIAFIVRRHTLSIVTGKLKTTYIVCIGGIRLQ